MNKNNEQYESLRIKLQKLQALAERGYNGETEAARIAIERICKKYGVKIEDVLDVETKRPYRFEIGRSDDNMQLFIRCHSSVCDVSKMTYWRPTRSSIEIDLTALQYAETLSLFNWHRDNFKREFEEFKKSFMSAYVSKHELFFNRECDKGIDKELTPEDIERIRRVLKLRDVMSDRTYHKLLVEDNE